MRLSDLIHAEAAAGAALFLRWQGYHVFSIPQRELNNDPQAVRFFGVGGKRQHGQESFADCALREGREEIGDVIQGLVSARCTYFLRATGELERIQLADEPIRPRLIWEKRQHSSYGSMAESNESYYLVAFDADLLAKPRPTNEIAALLYLSDRHLVQIQNHNSLTLGDLLAMGAEIDYQSQAAIAPSTLLVPHGTVHLLLEQSDPETNHPA